MILYKMLRWILIHFHWWLESYCDRISLFYYKWYKLNHHDDISIKSSYNRSCHHVMVKWFHKTLVIALESFDTVQKSNNNIALLFGKWNERYVLFTILLYMLINTGEKEGTSQEKRENDDARLSSKNPHIQKK